MATLSLRAEVQSPGVEPIAFSVVGFTCGSEAVIRRDERDAACWRLHLKRPGDHFRPCEPVFTSPVTALAYAEHWSDEGTAPISKVC